MKKILLFISLSFFIFSSLCAQQTGLVKGTVRDAETSESLIGVTIFVEPIHTGTSTDTKGRFEISLPVGEYVFQVSYIGYQGQEQTVKVTSAPQNLFFGLEPDVTTLSEIEVTSEKKDANVSRMAMSVQTLDMITIKKVPALMGEVDVIKTIQLLPGVQSASEGSSGFSVRGGGTDQNLILLDDAPIYNASHFLGFFSVFNNDVVKDATLYKGDIPANYGGRLSSVLDIQVKDEIPNKVHGQGGVGLVTSRLMLESPVLNHSGSLLLAGRTTYAGLLLPFMGEEVKGSDLYFYDLNAKYTQRINANNSISMSLYKGKDFFQMKETIGLGYGNTSATLAWNHIYGSRLTSKLSLIGSIYDYDIRLLYGPYDFTVGAGSKSAQVNLDYTMLWNENHTSRFGLTSGYISLCQGRLQDNGGAVAQYFNVDSITNIRRKGLEHAIYFTHDHVISPSFSLRYGVRISCFQNIGEERFYPFNEHHWLADTAHYYGPGEIFNTEIHPEPRFAAMYRINEVSSLKASYARSVQYMQVATAATGGMPFDVWFPINPNIKPQLCDQYAIGYFRNFLHDAVETSVEVYYKDFQNVIDFRDNAMTYGNILIDGELRFGKGRSYGVELLAKKTMGKFTGWIAYTYSRSFRTVEEINLGQEYRSPYDRPHNLSIVASYDITPHFAASASWIYNTGQPVTYPYGQYTYGGVTYAVYNGHRNESRYPDYHRLDMSLTWQIPARRWKPWSSELNFSVYNVYARHNTWAIIFSEDEVHGGINTKMMYLFSVIPSISYQFKF